MNSGFKEQSVVIAGGFRGMGLELARLLLADEANVFVIGKTQTRCKELRDSFVEYGEQICFFTADLSAPKGIEATQDEVTRWGQGKIHHLAIFLGSGKTPFGYDFPLDHWQNVLNTNLLVPIEVVQAFLPFLLHGEGSPSITLTAAIAGMERVRAPMTYGVAKTALISYANYLSDALIDKGIRVNSISPGNVFYKGGRWEEILRERPDEISKFLQESVGMKRLGTAKELAQVFFSIMSPNNSFMTGQNIVSDGLQIKRIL